MRDKLLRKALLVILPQPGEERQEVWKMKEGDVVKVYQDPFTKQDYEGDALLVIKRPEQGHLEGTGLERWDVEFIEEPGQTYSRIVGDVEATA